MRDAALQKLETNVQNDTIKESEISDWCSSIVVTKKKTGEICLCMDLRAKLSYND